MPRAAPFGPFEATIRFFRPRSVARRRVEACKGRNTCNAVYSSDIASPVQASEIDDIRCRVAPSVRTPLLLDYLKKADSQCRLFNYSFTVIKRMLIMTL